MNDLFKRNNITGMLEIIKANTSEARVRAQIPRIINYLLDRSDIIATTQAFENAGIDPLSVSSTDMGILAIRYLIAISKLNDAIILYNKLLTSGNTRKKHLLLIITELIRTEQFTIATDMYLASNYYPEGSDILLFPHLSRKLILEKLVGLPIIIDHKAIHDGVVFLPPLAPAPDKYQLRYVEMDRLALSNAIKTIAQEKKTVNFDVPKLTDNVNVDIVIDAANILYYGEREITLSSYQRLKFVIDYFADKNIIIVIHEKYCKPPPSFTKKDKQFIGAIFHSELRKFYKTPYGMNDDWYAIALAIANNARLLTNDLFRDHIYKFTICAEEQNKYFNLMQQWCQENVIKYEFKKHNTSIILTEPCKWSTVIQKSEAGSYYVPIDDGKWIQFIYA